jgi:hypothetical protein
MVHLIGESRLVGELTRELLSRKVPVVAGLGEDRPPEASIVVLAEGGQRSRSHLEQALSACVVSGGTLVWATDRVADDPELCALRRRGVPYTVVRGAGLIDLPSSAAGRVVLVPSDVERAPFTTLGALASTVASEIAGGRVGTGASIVVGARAGAGDWAEALREAGARAHVVPRWLASLAGVFGILRVEPSAGRVLLVASGSGAGRARELSPG